ncbi:MAG: AI-2E family transporter [Campylobacterota bacterium]|nr:AI-2E family transporter [Campylobacterota bacterium]
MKPQHFLLVLLTGILFFLSQLFAPFLKSLIIALLLTIATHSIHRYFEFKFKNIAITSIIMTLLLGLLFFVPILYFIFAFANYANHIDQAQITSIYSTVSMWVTKIPNDFIFIKEQLQELLGQLSVSQILSNVLSISGYIGKNSASFMMDMLLILIFYFFFSLYGQPLSYQAKEFIPLKMEDSNDLFFEVSNVMSIVFYSIIITAIFEGFLFGFFISMYGYNGLLLGVLYGFASLIPVVGGVLMWAPIAIYEIANGNIREAIIITTYSIIVISIIADTFIKPIIITYINKMVVKTPSKVNEILIFFAIVAGLSTFGFWGMILGPAMVTFFLSILQLLKKYRQN